MTETAGGSIRSELVWTALIACAGVVPRIIVILLIPTEPVSDFRGLVDFAAVLRDYGFAKGTWYWQFFNPGLPTLLSVVLRIVPGSPDIIARWTTAILTGLVPLIPFALWRRVIALRYRVLAGTLLALWPGQILFSGVVAQDNWVLIPTVALVALGVRSLILQDGGHPFLSSFLFTLGIYVRQEMFIVLLPVGLVSAGLGVRNSRLVRNLVIWTFTVAVLLLMIAGQRQVATGRFSLTTEHAGTSIIGTYAPGAGLDYWADPRPYIASIDHSLLTDRKRLQHEWPRVVLSEFLQRPQFHLIRMTSSVINCLRSSDVSNLYWSMTNPDVLSGEKQKKALAFSQKVIPILKGHTLIIHALFVASLILAFIKKDRTIFLISSAIALKILIHAVAASQPRYFVPVTALEMLAIAIAVGKTTKAAAKSTIIYSAAGAIAMTLLIGYGGGYAQAYVLAHDDTVQRLYRFTLNGPGNAGSLQCLVDQGRLVQLSGSSATIELFNKDPAPGEKARALCRIAGSEKSPSLALRIFDSYEPGGFPGRLFQRVVIGGNEVLRHDIAAEPGAVWMDVPIGNAGKDSDKPIGIEIIAGQPDPGCAWGAASVTTFELSVTKRE